MNELDTILFDLDGTITDPAEGITNSVSYALKKFGVKVENKSDLNCFIGPPLYASFMKYYGFSKEKAEKAVDFYREYYADKGIFECRLYDGIKELIIKLHSAGKRVVLATSKPEFFAEKLLRHFGLLEYFYHIAGATMDGSRIEKTDIINYAFDGMKSDKQNAVMIGDREFDIIGAKNVGIASIGVTFGYGSLEELEKSGADYIADRVEDIEKLLL